MNLITLPIPKSCTEMQNTYEYYYHNFYLEMVRMANSNLTEYVNKYIELLIELSKNPGSPDIIRSAIGVVSLHRFGFHDFSLLAKIFDRLVPQIDPEFVKFTSWCAGRLIHHPDMEQSRYVTHLFERCIDWSRSRGRRSRPLAAAHMIHALSTNAGSNVVIYFPLLQSVVWLLVSHPSTQVLRATSDGIAMYTRAILRYGRSDLDNYLNFFYQLCEKLLYFGDPIREYAALVLFEKLIKGVPDHFLQYYLQLYETITDAVEDEPMLVQGAAYVTLGCFCKIDPKLYVENIAEEHFEKTIDVLLEFPRQVVDTLVMLCEKVPDFIITRISDMRSFAKSLVSEPDSDFVLLTGMLKFLGQKCLPIDNDLIQELMEAPLGSEFINFFVQLAITPNAMTEKVPEPLSKRICIELKSKQPIYPLKLISKLPPKAFAHSDEMLNSVQELATDSSVDVRCVVPKAMFILSTIISSDKTDNITKNLLQSAIFEQSLIVRYAILEVLLDHCNDNFSTPEFMKFFQIFVNDDSASVRQIVFRILAKLSESNPLAVSSLTRCALLDSFFIIRHVPSIRQRSRYVTTLPDLIKASATTIKAYSGGFMDIVMNILIDYNPLAKFSNFLEEDANTTILIGIMDSLALLAPLDPEQVAHHGEIIIPLLCDLLLTNETRSLSLAILNALLVLMSAPASTVQYREKTPMILSACSTFLANTHSRKARMATLKVLGAIGVLEVHQRPPPAGCSSPENIDDALARQFFHPNRDSEGDVDDSLLIQNQTTDQYFVGVAATSLLDIFKDENMKEFYEDAVQALVQVLHHPRMHMLTFFDAFVTRLLDVMEQSSDQDLTIYLPLYTQLVLNSTHNTSPFLERSLKLITDKFCPNLHDHFLDLILAFLSSIRDGFSPYASETICLLVGCLDDTKQSNAKTSKRVLQAFSQIGVFSTDLLYLIIPQVCDTILCEQTLQIIRIMALGTLTDLVCSVDLSPYLGPIVRALGYGLYFEDQATSNASFELLYTLLKTQGHNFLKNAGPLLESIKKNKMETAELKQIIKDIARAPPTNHFKPIRDNNKNRAHDKPVNHPHQCAEDAILAKIHTPNLGLSRHLEQWLRSLILTVISNSPSDPIRVCTTLASSYFPLALKLFNPAFLSCWRKISELGKEQISRSFREMLLANESYESVAREIINLLVFMDKIEQPIKIKSKELADACVRYGAVAYALHVQQQIYEENPGNIEVVGKLIDLFVELGDWPNAIGVWKKTQMLSSTLNKTDVLARLRMWDQAEPAYRDQFQKTHNFESFFGLSKSLASMAMWTDLMTHIDHFNNLKRHQKRSVAAFFAEAALHLGRWDILEDTLQYAPNDSSRCITLSSISALHKKDYDALDALLIKGFSVLASRPITFWADNQQIHKDTMKAAQELIEINEMKKWVTGQVNHNALEEVWNERLKTAPRDFELWFSLIANRARVTDIRDENLIQFFQLNSATLGTKIHVNAFEILFPEFSFDDAPDLHKVCYVITHWKSGEKQKALEEMFNLADKVSEIKLKALCHYFYASWLIEAEDDKVVLKKAYSHLEFVVNAIRSDKKQEQPSTRHFAVFGIDNDAEKINDRIQKTSISSCHLVLPSQIFKELTTDTVNIEMMRKWSDVNTSLIECDPSNLTLYVTNSITALTRCTELSPSFPDVVQLLNLFFEHANQEDVYKQTKHSIEKLNTKLLLQASPQLLIQLSHSTPVVAKFVHDTVFQLLLNHYHALIFSLIVLKKSKNVGRANAAEQILDEFKQSKPEQFAEIEIIRKAMLRAAVTWNEKILQRITDAFDHYQRHRIDRMVASLSSILDVVKKPRCEMHQQFLLQFQKNIHMLGQILHIFHPKNTNCMAQLSQWCKTMQDLIGEELKRIRMIQLSAISPELCNRTDFFLAVPGTYKPNKPVVHIKYFVGQFSVYVSKQQPKDVLVKGDDGNFYQYLLKGHEDLRLDERIMQFFRLINSLIMKETVFKQNLIRTTSVIPLSMSHGLVQWVPGTDTLRAVVEQQRALHGRDPMEEYNLAEQYSYNSFDFLMPVQKMQVIERIYKDVSDNDIANVFWLKARNADEWLKHTNTFAISTGMTSIVGYVIGLGDRHPSNLLIDRFTGKVIHIDFGDCFERAANRKFLPEVVPFRLTRMMAKAMGVTGVDGLFRSSFVNMSQLLRDNKRVLVMVLSTFVHEPLVDPDSAEDQEASQKYRVVSNATTGSVIDKGRVYMAEEAGIQSSVEMRRRVKQKLTGADYDDDVCLSVEDQATWLIQSATSIYNLSRMYSGWCPFW